MGRVLLAGVLVVTVTGCGQAPYQVAPVSGRVTLNGQPLPRAHVHFAPIGTLAHNPGPTSQGLTDADGRFTLRLDNPPESGAVVGRSRVFITVAGAATTGPQPDGGGKRTREVLPARYHRDTVLEFEVSTGGTNKADFELTSP
jgi:hypothetical protein